jgi:hypothetical protein
MNKFLALKAKRQTWKTELRRWYPQRLNLGGITSRQLES